MKAKLVRPKRSSGLAAAVDRLLSDPPLRARLGAAARQRCEQLFSLEAHVATVVQQYVEVVRKSARVIA
jgi:glycosyltransferase involved in cell wall biosynthesis